MIAIYKDNKKTLNNAFCLDDVALVLDMFFNPNLSMSKKIPIFALSKSIR
jgi:hypothetical protein